MRNRLVSATVLARCRGAANVCRAYDATAETELFVARKSSTDNASTITIGSMGFDMTHLTRTICIMSVWSARLFTTGIVLVAGLPENASEKVAYIGQPVSLAISPESIQLAGPRAMQQILVTGRYSDGSERDLTNFCDIQAESPELVRITRGGLLRPETAGETKLVIHAGEQSVRVPVVVTEFDKPHPVSFRHEFIAALNVAGCNAGACHGIPSGRGGFNLSLRGYDPAADFLELTHSALGRRTNRFDAEGSLILKKGIGLVAHAGGPRLLSINPIPQETIRAWLAGGLLDDPSSLPALTRVEVLPASRIQFAPSRWQQLAVLAHFGDGSVRDVTRLTAFSSSDESIAGVDANGLVELKQTGEAAILCRYLSIIECARLTYLDPQPNFGWSDPPLHNEVDRHIFAKLKMLNIAPADLCTDEEFLRRAFLDLCGILPTPDECRHFLADTASDKRSRLIDALLERPEFADFLAHKWLDVLRSNRLTIQIKGSHAYRLWLRSHIERNTPWNKVVSELLSASGSTFANPPANYFRGPYDNGAPVVKGATDLAESTSQLFFGIRLQCAKCHNHPFERWTQDDYYKMVAWFSRLKAVPDTENPGSPPQPYPWQLRENALVIYSAGTGEAAHPQSGQPMPPKVLGLPTPAIPPGTDRRTVLAELVTSPENPYFARATVNRLWYHLLGRGIVDPPDDFRDSNPAANDAVLDVLAHEFIASNFDVKHVVRMIANSRTYQLSSHAKLGNPEDEKYFSHALVRRKRLTAELLLDAVCAATGAPETFTGMPEGTRAMQLPDGQVIYTGGRYASWDRHPFLKAFGQPAREAACECEREGDLNLARALEMKNGDFLLGKLRTAENRIGRLLANKTPDAEILNELFLATLSRPPLVDEAQTALDHVAGTADKRAAWENIQWALLNTNEFLFRH
jgi:hypothetical protein